MSKYCNKDLPYWLDKRSDFKVVAYARGGIIAFAHPEVYQAVIKNERISNNHYKKLLE